MESTSINSAAPAGSGGEPLDFIRTQVVEDLSEGTYGGRVVTRFPPEPNGFLHIGHVKSICLNFGVAQEYGGRCHLRFDDTNPETEDMMYVEAIQRDIRWLGFDWGEHLYFASDYYEQLYQFAEQLILDGKAYVDSLNEEEIRAYRGTVTEAGRPSPYRQRSVEENLDLFRRMRAGEFPDGAHVLRAKIDMAAENMKLRDPLLYRIRHASHYRTGDDWCIYPMYDFAHPLSDAIERITHSLCTLEFENNRAIYDWLVDNLTPAPQPRQYEFARLNLDYTVMSKRKLLQLVNEGHVAGWDDPRLPTVSGMRRRGYRPEALRAFAHRSGVSKVNSRAEFELLEHYVRDDLNQVAPRVMCVLRPLKVVLTNYPAGETEWIDAPYYPHDVPKEGSRRVPFGRELYIEREDFMEQPVKGFHRLSPGAEVRLRYGYIIRCDEVVKDPGSGEVVELRCTYDPATRHGETGGRRVKGTLHWVSAAHALPCAVRLYDRLFTVPNPEDVEEGKSFKEYLNPKSVEVLRDSRIEPSVAQDEPGTRYQFERQGYFVQDMEDSAPGALVFNRIVQLRDSWTGRAPQPQPKGEADKPAPTKKRADEEAQPPMEPDVPETVSEAREKARAGSRELAAKYELFQERFGLPREDADMLTGDEETARFFEDAAAAHGNAKLAANWIIHEVMREAKGRPLAELPFGGAQVGALAALIEEGVLSSAGAREVLAEMARSGGEPAAIVEARGLRQIDDAAALAPLVEQVIAAHGDKAAQYRSGKTGLLGFFTGQVMKESDGKANPQLVQQLLQEKLNG